MSREIMQQALDALKHHRQQTTFQFQQTSDAIKALEAALAQPEQAPKLTDAGVDTNIPLWGLEPKGSGMVTFHQSNPEHQPWCDYLNIMLTSMPPQRAKCNCKNAQPAQEPVAWDDDEWVKKAMEMSRDFVERAKARQQPPPTDTITMAELRKTDLYRKVRMQLLRDILRDDNT